MSELDFLKQRICELRTAMVLIVGAFVLLLCTTITNRAPVYANDTPQELRVRRLAIVDSEGIERVVISAPVPDPIINGKRVKRQGAASGIIIYDRNGAERGGYLTSDESSNGAMLTLDGVNQQVVTLYANADNGATISLNNQAGDGLTLTTYNTPVLQMSHKRHIIFKQPADAPDLH